MIERNALTSEAHTYHKGTVDIGVPTPVSLLP